MTPLRRLNPRFRPASYWVDLDPLHAALRNVKGSNRRRMIHDYWRTGRLAELDDTLLQPELDPATRERLGRIHPSFLGGDFLPSYQPGEVGIARVELASATADVISLRARPDGDGIAYRAVDEYDTCFVLPLPRSPHPLTHAEVCRQFDDGRERDSESAWGLGLAFCGADPDDRESFRGFARVSSNFYPDLAEHYRRAHQAWITQGRAS